MVTSGYVQEPVADGGVRFVVTPVPIAAPPWAPIGGALLFAATTLLALPTPGGAQSRVLEYALVALASAWVYGRVRVVLERRLEAARRPGGAFVVSPRRIETHNVALPCAAGLRLSVRNASASVPVAAEVPAGVRYAFAPDDAAPDAGRSASAYLLCAEADGAVVTLAGGMTLATALGLLADVSRILSVH